MILCIKIITYFLLVDWLVGWLVEKRKTKMQTRSEIQKQIQENEKVIQEIQASFDAAHQEWTANKKKGKYGMYSYVSLDREKRNKI